MNFLQGWGGLVLRSTDPDLQSREVIPGLEKPPEAGINRTPGESLTMEYRA
jgi:hypothetical protein